MWAMRLHGTKSNALGLVARCCVATGKTIDQALRRIERAVEIHIRGLREDGLTPPQPRHRAVTPMRTPRQVDFFATIQVAA